MAIEGNSNGAAATEAKTAPAADGPMTFGKMMAEKGEEIVQDDTKADGGDNDEEEADSGDADSDEESSESADEEAGESADESGSGDDSSADDDEGAEGKGKKDKADGEKGADDKDLEEVAKKAVDGKTLSLKHGDKEYKIPKDAKFTFEKDGKKVDFTLDQVGNQLITRREIDQQFTKLDADKKDIARRERTIQQTRLEHDDIQDKLSLIQEAATTGDLFDIVQAALNMFSDGDTDVTNKLFEQLLKTTNSVSAMTEDELKSTLTNSQLAFKNRTLVKDKAKADAQLERQAQKEWLSSELKSKGIPWEEYTESWTALKAIEANRQKNGQSPRFHDKMTYEEVAGEVVKYTLASRFFNRVANVVGKLDSTKVGDNKLIASVCELTDPSYSEKDIQDIVRGVLGISLKKKVSKATDSSKEVSTAPAKPKGPEAKEAPPKKAPVATETKKNDDEDEGPLTFGKLIKRYS